MTTVSNKKSIRKSPKKKTTKMSKLHSFALKMQKHRILIKLVLAAVGIAASPYMIKRIANSVVKEQNDIQMKKLEERFEKLKRN